MRIKSMVAAACALAFLLAFAPGASAALLYEGFDYGPTAEPLAGNGGNTDGFIATETWSVEPTSFYSPTDLGPLGSNAATGGSAALNAISSGTDTVSRGINATVAPGSTVYGAFLFQRVGSQAPTNQVDFTDSATGLQFGVLNTLFGNTDAAFLPFVAADGANPFGTFGTVERASFQPAQGETYAVLFELSNVNGVSGTSTMDLWALNEAQLASVLADDDITSGELAALAIGDAANQITQRGTATSASGNTSTFNMDHFLNLRHRTSTNSTTGGNTANDEITLSAMSLNDVFGAGAVAAIPEPSTLSLTSVALISGGLLRRRRR